MQIEWSTCKPFTWPNFLLILMNSFECVKLNVEWSFERIFLLKLQSFIVKPMVHWKSISPSLIFLSPTMPTEGSKLEIEPPLTLSNGRHLAFWMHSKFLSKLEKWLSYRLQRRPPSKKNSFDRLCFSCCYSFSTLFCPNLERWLAFDKMHLMRSSLFV